MLYTVADFAARHAIAVLVVITIATLAVSALAWRLLVAVGPRLNGTLTVARYLGIVAILGFALSAGATVLFFELADEIGVDESLAQFDVALSAALREHLSLETLRMFSIVTHLGDGPVLSAIGAVVFVVLAVKRRRLVAAAWAVTTLGGGLLNRILKVIFERSRPLHDHGLTAAEGWSFPSGHASGSMLVYGLLAYIVVRNTSPPWHIPVAFAGIALIIFVGSSRVLLQVHYLSDVLAGYAHAAIWVGVCIATLEAVRWRGRQTKD